MPNARVMTFGYNADAAFGNTTAGILDHARSLLSSLIDKREGTNVDCRYPLSPGDIEAEKFHRSCADLLYSLGIRSVE